MVFIDDIDQMLVILDLLTLRDLEHDLICGEVIRFRRLQARSDTDFRLIHRVGKEIDIQIHFQPQFTGQFDSLDPAGLIETITIGVIHLRQNGRRRFPLRAANQRLIGNDPALRDINDRLKGKAEFKAQAFATGTLITGKGCWLIFHSLPAPRKTRLV